MALPSHKGSGKRESYPERSQGSFWDDFFNFGQLSRSSGGSNLPAVNIKESNRDYHVEVAAPGLDKKDFNIELDNDVLMISSQHELSNEEKDEAGNYTRREFSFQSFQRSFTLPEGVDPDSISAQYQNGVLDITIPKKEEEPAKQKKNISIK